MISGLARLILRGIDIIPAAPYNHRASARSKMISTQVRQSAEDSYAIQHVNVLDKLERLRKTVEDLPAPDGEVPINWGHVGSLDHINRKLLEILEFMGQ